MSPWWIAGGANVTEASTSNVTSRAMLSRGGNQCAEAAVEAQRTGQPDQAQRHLANRAGQGQRGIDLAGVERQQTDARGQPRRTP